MVIDCVPLSNCKNQMATYGEICVRCNKCHRFDLYCLNCGKRTGAIGSYKTWKFVELMDIFRIPVCPTCQKYFTPEEMALNREWWDRDVIPVYRKDFQRRG